MNRGENVQVERAKLMATLERGLAVSRHPLFRHGRGREGLGQAAGQTFGRVEQAGVDGITVEELSAVRDPRTIRRHLEALAGYGLVEDRDGRWYRTATPLP